jgi:hypothetical protein
VGAPEASAAIGGRNELGGETRLVRRQRADQALLKHLHLPTLISYENEFQSTIL